MRVGFALTLPEQLDRLEPVARRIPGARWIVPAGRWPSPWLDSRQWLIEALERRGLPEPAAPLGELDLVLLSGGVPSEAVGPWLAPTGAPLRLSDERDTALEAGGLAVAAAWGSDSMELGDPRLDEARGAAARARARSLLGLSTDAPRPVLLVRSERGGVALARLAPAVARMRAEWDIVVAPSAECWLRSPRPVPAALHGPGVLVLRDSLRWSELLSLADAVLAEPGRLALDAAALGLPTALMTLESPRSGRVGVPSHWPHSDVWSDLPQVHDPQDLVPESFVRREAALELRDHLRPRLLPLVGEIDGCAARRVAEKVRSLAAERALERTLSELTHGAAPL